MKPLFTISPVTSIPKSIVSTQKLDNSLLKTTVRVSAPARLHLGFLDLNGSTGRKFGSIGLAVNTHQTIIEAQLTTTTSILNNATTSQDICRKVEQFITRFYNTLGRDIPIEKRGVTLSLIELIPEHAGLGSGTQLAITIGTALCKLHQISITTAGIAALLGRGSRSGIGIAIFDHGGFIIDGGMNDTSSIPPLLVHYDFPQNWRIVMVMDKNQQGVHGSQELAAFNNLPTFPLISSQAICHLTLMKLLPALVEQKIADFGQAITDIQLLIGDHFSPIQGGNYASQHVEALLNYATSLGHSGIAQTSWGPTGCVFVDSEQSAQQLINQLSEYAHTQMNSQTELSFIIAQANSSGANIEIITT
ncbi:MAG: beta-hydroxylase [Piscirickettsiaceae bacterium]|nr:beta-hydroxylase [Piscirickettsiaceae bacterium]